MPQVTLVAAFRVVTGTRKVDQLPDSDNHPARRPISRDNFTQHEFPSQMALLQAERQVGVKLDLLSSWYSLDMVKGFGPQKAKDIWREGISPETLLEHPQLLPHTGATGDRLSHAIDSLSEDDIRLARKRALSQMRRAAKLDATILTYDHQSYPVLILESNNPSPVLYARGNLRILKNPKAIACVGTRQISNAYSNAHARFTTHAAANGWTIVSGFALGADTIGHRSAIAAGGTTICVMPSGLDRPFPPENRELWRELETCDQAAMISELPFGTSASSMNLRKRNKLIVASAQAVLVSQSAEKGGAMNAFRFAVEQHKPVATFEWDESEATSGNRHIANEHRIPTTVLAVNGDQGSWNKWLEKLSSLI